MVVGHHALALERRGDGDPEPLREPSERADRPVACNAGPREHDRVRRRREGARGSLHLVLGGRRVAGNVDLERLGVGRALRDVFRQHDERGAGPLGLGLLERLPNHLGCGVAQRDHVAPLGERAVDRDEVDDLMGLLEEPVEPGLCHQRDERMGVQLRVGDPEHEVERARTERRETDPRATGQRAVDVRHESGATFVARRDEPDRRVGHGVDHVEVLLPRQAEHVLDALVLQARDQELRDVALVPGCHARKPTLARREAPE